MTARFNGYFNAKEKMKEVEASQFKQQQDKFDRIIPVFTVGDEQSAKGYYSDLETIIKKCTNVIRKHEISKWIDDCYLLIGKAYYYKRDYYTALETFDYLNTRYPDGMPAQESKLWVTRVLMDMGKMNDVQAQITTINLDKKYPEELKKRFRLIEADYYIRTQQYKQAIEKLESAMPDVKGKNYKARYMFILAQLNQQTGNMDKAAEYYNAVIKKNPGYDLAFQSKLGLSEVSANTATVRKYLEKLIKDDKNISYFDQIYYTLAKIELKDNHPADALNYLNLSVRNSTSNPNQKARSYLLAGDIYFNRQDYAIAKQYYDSASTNMTKDFLNYTTFQARQVVLSDLVKNLITIQREDSLQRLAMLPRQELDNAVNKAIEADKLKAQQIEDQKSNNQTNNNSNKGFNPNFNSGSMGDPNATANPFYNQTSIAQGYQNFLQVWGDRPLEDNWRRKNKITTSDQSENRTGTTKDTLDQIVGNKITDSSLVNLPILKNLPVEKQKYYMDIPFTSAQRSASDVRIQNAMFAIATIYSEKLDENQKAISYYENLLKRYPNFKDELVVHYNLYRLYSEMKDETNAQLHKDYILKQHPGSTYALLIEHPEQLRQQFEQKDKNPEIEKLYANAFEAYQRQDCGAIRSNWHVANGTSGKNYLNSKFAYLSMLCNVRNDSTGQQLDSVNSFIVKYPGEEITTQATVLKTVLEQRRVEERKKQQLQTQIQNQPKQNDSVSSPQEDKKIITQHTIKPAVAYTSDQNKPHFYVFVFPAKADANAVKAAFSDFNKEHYPGIGLEISSFLLDDSMQIITVKNFPDKQRTFYYYKELKLSDLYDKLKLPKHSEFIISNENLPLFVRNKDLEGYLAFFKKNYL
jgi:tetratricopeptide (TPR) repeat protein